MRATPGGRAQPVILHHERVAAQGNEPGRWMLLLHGIFGAGRNWATVARRVVAERPDWGIVLVDLRQHGASQGFPAPHTLAACAADLRELVTAEELNASALLGHSFGGKVALVYAREPARSLAQLWIVDSTPDAREPSGSAWAILQVLRGVPDSFEDRDAGVRALVERGVAAPTAQWMVTNLVRGADGRLRWRISVDDMDELMQDFFRRDAWDVVERPPAGLVLHFVKAEESSVLSPDACDRLLAAGERVHLHRVEGGHWLNADNPEALVRLLSAELPR
jgi:pimeloyl-ACP methyl ester carboxylesterase